MSICPSGRRENSIKEYGLDRVIVGRSYTIRKAHVQEIEMSEQDRKAKAIALRLSNRASRRIAIGKTLTGLANLAFRHGSARLAASLLGAS